MADNFASAKAKAQKILGKDAKIPDAKFIPKLQSDTDSAFAAYRKTCDDLETKILELQKTMAGAKLTIKQFAEKLDDENFGLDEKNKDDAKKIKDAQALFDAWSDDLGKQIDGDISALDDLDKHLMDFRKYKPKPTDK